MADRKYLWEGEVVSAVAEYFRAKKCQATPVRRTRDPGIDLDVVCEGRRLRIEAKGGGAEAGTSKGPGGRFKPDQVKHHAAEAVYRVVRWLSEADPAEVGIAVPDDAEHRKRIGDAMAVLKRLGVRLFFVDVNRTVKEE